MIRLFKIKDKEGIWVSHSKGLLESQIEFFKGLTTDNRLVCFLDKDGGLTLKLSNFEAQKDDLPENPVTP